MFYINYGISKSGSTLTFELTHHLLNLAGHEQVAIPAEVILSKAGKDHYSNPVRKWTPEVTAALEAMNPPTIQLLRTHYRPSPSVADLIERGVAKHMVGIRDPRDVALSMLDVADRLTKAGVAHRRVQAGELDTVFENLTQNLETCLQWHDIPNGLVLDYEQTAFSVETTLDQISAQLGLGNVSKLYPEAIERAERKTEKKKNVARPHRHRREMSAEDQRRIIDMYPAFYERFYPDAQVIVEEDDSPEAQAEVLERQAKLLEKKLKQQELKQARNADN